MLVTNVLFPAFQVVQVDDAGQLFISPTIEEWAPLADSGIDVVIDLEGELDTCIPTRSNDCLYIYFPITDDNEAEPPFQPMTARVEPRGSPVGHSSPLSAGYVVDVLRMRFRA